MVTSPRQLGTYSLSILVAAALIACSSSNNNKSNNNSNSRGNTAVTTVATTASTVLAKTATPAIAATTTVAPTTASRTATPASGNAARTPTPSSASGSATRAASPSASGVDAKLQAALKAAALQPSDLPTGFSKQDESEGDLSTVGEVASYEITYGKIDTTNLNIQAIVTGLVGFKDTGTAQTQFKDVSKQITQQAGSDFALELVNNGPKIGDETQSFKVSGSAGGVTLGGYAILWRRGRLAAVLVSVGVPAPASIDTLTPLAQKQDNNLKTVQQ